MPKIVVVGDYNIDLVLYLDRFPERGETLSGNKFYEGPGGKGSNQAIAAARLGAEVTFFGAIGQDHYGQVALHAWQAAGVRTDYLMQTALVSTAVAMIYVDSSGNNMVAVNQGANLLLKPENVETIADDIKAADMVMCTLGVPLDVVRRVFQIAHTAKVPALLNPAPAQSLPSDMLSLAKYLTPNESELAIVAQAGASSVTPESARHIFQRDDQTLIVTQGEAGATWVTHTDMGTVPTFEVDVKDTVGAGDAFNAGLAVALTEGKSLDEAVRFANATAALSVTKQGAVAGMPRREDVDHLLAEA
jgi:ribokinase